MNNLPLKELSASQISTFLDCNRSWGYAYLENRRPPPDPSTALGSEVHRQLEEWAKNKVMPTSSIAVTGIKHMPPPGIGAVEERISFGTPNSLWRGAIDLHYDLINGMLAVQPFTTGTTVVHDHKTSGNPRYIKTPADLAADIQANLYAFWAFGTQKRVMGSFGRVDGKWVYMATKGAPKATPVSITFDRARVEGHVEEIDVHAKQVQTLYQLRPKASELTPNYATCDKYRGCFHRDVCPRSPQVQGFSFGSDTSSSEGASMSEDFKAFIEANMSKLGAPPPPPVMVAPPAPPAPPAIPTAPSVDPLQSIIDSLPEDSRAVFDYMTSTLKKSAADALVLLGVETKAPSVPAPPAPPPVAPAVPSLPKPEFGFVNPPEAQFVELLAEPPVAPAVPAVPATPAAKPERDILDDMDRDQLKPIGVFLGVMTESNRFGEPKIRQLIRGVNGWETKIADMGRVAAPVTVPETVQSEFEARMKDVVVAAPKVPDPDLPEYQELAEATPAIGASLVEEDTRPPSEFTQRMTAHQDKLRATQEKEDARIRTIVREEVTAVLQEFFGRLAR